MAVQLHCDGVIYDIDPSRSDPFWITYIEDTLEKVRSQQYDGFLGLNLADGNGAKVWLTPSSTIGIVAPAGMLFPPND